MIQSWGLTLLEEISVYSQEVHQLMDDWIVEAVSQENLSIKEIIDSISEFIRSSSIFMVEDEFTLMPTKLTDIINIKPYDIN